MKEKKFFLSHLIFLAFLIRFSQSQCNPSTSQYSGDIIKAFQSATENNCTEIFLVIDEIPNTEDSGNIIALKGSTDSSETLTISLHLSSFQNISIQDVSIEFNGFLTVSVDNLRFEGGESDKRSYLAFEMEMGEVLISNCFFGYGYTPIQTNVRLTLSKCTFFQNTGGIYAVNRDTIDILIYDSTFQSNAISGVIIGSLNSVTVENSHFINQTHGCIDGARFVSISNSLFENNARRSKSEVAEDCESGLNGAAVCAGDVEVANSTFVNNFAFFGAAIFSTNTVTITNGTFLNNLALLGGPAIFSTVVKAKSSHFENNYCLGESTAILSRAGSVEIDDCIFRNNTRDPLDRNQSGAISSGTILVENSVFENNFSGCTMGTVSTTLRLSNFTGNFGFNAAVASGQGEILIEDCIFLNNSVNGAGSNEAGIGGVIQMKGDVSVYRTLFKFNSASNYAGAIYMEGRNTGIVPSLIGSMVLNQVSFISNSASWGGAIVASGDGNYEANLYFDFVDVSAIDNKATSGSGGFFHQQKSDTCTININGITATGNSAKKDGGFFSLENSLSESYITINNAIVQNNKAEKRGGGFFLSRLNAFHLDNFNLIENHSFLQGGGIYFVPSVVTELQFTMNNVTAEGNKGSSGGVVFGDRSDLEEGGSFSVLSSSFTKNTATLGSGGSFLLEDTTDQVTFDSCTFSENTASLDGGGIKINTEAQITSLMLNNISSFRNVAGNNGGMLSLSGGFGKVHMKNFAANFDYSINTGGSVYIVSTGNTTSLSVLDSIVTNCSASSVGGGWYVAGEMHEASFSNSFWSNNTCQDYSGGGLAVRLFAYLLNITKCSFDRNEAGYQGGGFALQSTSVVSKIIIDGVDAKRNRAIYGAALSFSAQVEDIMISNSNIRGNIAFEGAGVAVDGSFKPLGSVEINNSTFSGNYGSYRGSAISTKGSVAHWSLKGSVISDSTGGAGAFSIDGNIQSIQVEDTHFLRNNLTGLGGGMNVNQRAIVQSFNISNCFFASNQALEGGAICTRYGTVTEESSKKRKNSDIEIYGSQFINNIGDQDAGAISMGGDAIIVNSSFENNSVINGRNFGLVILNGTTELRETSFINSPIVMEDYANMKTDSQSLNLINCGVGKSPKDIDGIVSCQNFTVVSSSLTNAILYVEKSTDSKTIIMASLVAFAGAMIAVIALAIYVVRVKRQKARLKNNDFSMIDFSTLNLGAAKKSILDFDEFKNLKEVGSGSFGVVFKAEWRELHIAVKQIKNENVSEQQVKEFLREVALLQGLRSHPNVVLFLGITFPPQRLSLVTEFCEGGGLYPYLRKHKVDEQQKIQFILGIAKGLLHLHAEKVIHRDLAVRNILLSKHLEVKVSDFGLSREQASVESTNVTATNVGPLKWMSPESILRREYSIKSDVFSFGVVMYEIFLVVDPWAKISSVQAAIEVANNGKRMEIPKNIHPTLASLMSLCWSQDPEQRPDFGTICTILDDDFSGKIINPKEEEPEEVHNPLMESNPLTKSDRLLYDNVHTNSNPMIVDVLYTDYSPSNSNQDEPANYENAVSAAIYQ
eukprot:TRINITY_DN3251_c0_g1_i1.p1 TRINITY_DN3251_c0_g1~~TRINITY_DN3251_c0_g1_i1.p1  ORF type:complete len:1571 (+),score=426.26 TRINITY_DN3251_c0_g1_i1:57-4715(+)